MYSLQTYVRGDEVRLYYRKPVMNEELILRYAAMPISNPHDYFSIHISTSSSIYKQAIAQFQGILA